MQVRINFLKYCFVVSPTKQAKNTGDIAVSPASSKFMINSFTITLIRK